MLPLRSIVLAVAVLVSSPPRPVLPYGATSPEAAAAGYDRALHAHDAGGAARYIAPATRREVALEAIAEIVSVLEHFNPDNPTGGRALPPGPELEERRSNHSAAVDIAANALKPFGLDRALTLTPTSIAGDHALSATIDTSDSVVLISKIFAALPAIGSKLFDADPDDPALHDLPVGPVTDIRIVGNDATATASSETVRFQRIDERWYIVRPLIFQLPHTPKGA